MNQSGSLDKAAVMFRDGLGDRRRMTDSTGAEADLLCLAGEIASVPGVEPALRKSVSRLAAFRHPAFCELRSVERFDGATLAVISDAAHGLRLSELLVAPPDRRAPLDLAASLHVIRQTIAAVDALHGFGDVAHGAIGPERLVVTPRGRVIVTDYGLGTALEQLRYSHQHYWKSLRVPLPRSAGLTRFDQRVDVTQLGVVALTLFLGRMLRDDEYSAKLVDVAASFQTMGVTGDLEPLRPELSAWLSRALQLDSHHSFTSASEARIELESLLSEEERAAGAASVDRILTRLGIAPEPPAPEVVTPVARPPQPVRPPEPAPPPAPPVVIPVAARVEIPVAPPPPPLPAFSAAVAPPMPPPAARRAQPSPWPRVAIGVVVLAVLTTTGLYALRRRGSTSALATGTLTVQSNPAGVPIDIDGKASGVTPATVSLAAGTHTILLRPGGEPKTMTIAMAAGAQISQYIELAKTAPTSGGLVVRTDPPGAQVSIDRVPQGASPVSVASLTPGDHSITVSSDGVSVEQIVTVEAGMTSSLVVPISARERGPMSGWIAVTSPIEIQIFESGRLLGTNQSDRIMVPAGEHRLDLVNEALGYRAARTVSVPAGKVESMTVKLPMGSMSVNAVPWAEVWLDGEKAGDTPIGNLQTTIGRHEVVFRHPDLGESRQTVTVTLSAPARLSVDMRKK
jgi:PEGA domain